MQKIKENFVLPNPLEEPTISVERAGQMLGIGRSKAYELVQANEFPAKVLKMGKTYHVLTASLLEALGLDTYLAFPLSTVGREPNQPARVEV